MWLTWLLPFKTAAASCCYESFLDLVGFVAWCCPDRSVLFSIYGTAGWERFYSKILLGEMLLVGV
jgi:hypothetical protein